MNNRRGVPNIKPEDRPEYVARQTKKDAEGERVRYWPGKAPKHALKVVPPSRRVAPTLYTCIPIPSVSEPQPARGTTHETTNRSAGRGVCLVWHTSASGSRIRAEPSPKGDRDIVSERGCLRCVQATHPGARRLQVR